MPLNAIQTDYTPGRPNKQTLDRRRHPEDEDQAVTPMASPMPSESSETGHIPGVAADTSAAIVGLERGSAVTFDLVVRRYASV